MWPAAPRLVALAAPRVAFTAPSCAWRPELRPFSAISAQLTVRRHGLKHSALLRATTTTHVGCVIGAAHLKAPGGWRRAGTAALPLRRSVPCCGCGTAGQASRRSRLGLRHAPVSASTCARSHSSADRSPKLVGAYQNGNGTWFSRIRANGKQEYLGTFYTAEDASAAYMAAKQRREAGLPVSPFSPDTGEATDGVPRRPGRPGARATRATQRASAGVTSGDDDDDDGDDDGTEDDDGGDGGSDDDDAITVPTTPPPGSAPVPGMLGVYLHHEAGDGASAADSDWDSEFEEDAAARYEAVIVVKGMQVSGGKYETAEEAARAFDALTRMYHGAEAETNFDRDDVSSAAAAAAWVPPTAEASHHIEVRLGENLTVDEIVRALEAERGIDVTFLDLAGRSDLADFMVFVTGRSVSHMRKLGDMLVDALRKRRLPDLDVVLEGRDEDYWMVVDAGNIIVNIFDDEAREVFDIENFYANMKIDEDPWEGMSFEEWLEANPVPEKWIRRLERDEMEE